MFRWMIDFFVGFLRDSRKISGDNSLILGKENYGGKIFRLGREMTERGGGEIAGGREYGSQMDKQEKRITRVKERQRRKKGKE